MILNLKMAAGVCLSAGTIWSAASAAKAEVVIDDSNVAELRDGLKSYCEENARAEGCGGFNARDLFVGVGIGFTSVMNDERVDSEDIDLVELEDGRVFVQRTESEDSAVRVLFETHYLLRDQSIVDPWAKPYEAADGTIKYRREGGIAGAFFNSLAAVAACGPFAFVAGGDSPSRRGCGPFIATALDADASVVEFGGGWLIGFGGDDAIYREQGERNTGFALGLGVMFDPDSSKLDRRVVNSSTGYVNDDFVAAVLDADDPLSVVRKDTTTSFLIFVTKDF